MVDQCLQKWNDEHTHKCDDWTEEYLVWKQEIVRNTYMLILDQTSIVSIGYK